MFSPAIQETSPFAEEFRALARAEAQSPVPRGSILFYGSSSVRLWDSLFSDFAGLSVVNHGFGGSTLADCLVEMERLVYPIAPRVVVLYAGDNDLDQGASPEHVAYLLGQMLRGIRDRLGAIPVLILSVKPSPVRFWNIGKIRHSNQLMAEIAGAAENVHYLDVFTAMLDERGGPRHEMFTEDGLHMNRRGYTLWASVVRERLANLHLID